MKKMIYTALGLTSVSAMATEKMGVMHQPDLWMPVTAQPQGTDFPEYIGMPTQLPGSLPTYVPDNFEYATFLQNIPAWGNWVIFSVLGVLVLLTIFTMINGSVKLKEGFSGKMLARWTNADIAIHWLGGISCLILIVTGVMMAAGKFYLEPHMGANQWIGFIDSAVGMHSVFAFPFIVGAILMATKWAKRQLPEAGDLNWFMVLGGYFNFGPLANKEADAGFANAGEKLWFWTFVIGGAVLIVSGLSLMFPGMIAESSNGQNLALKLHLLGAVVVGAFAMIHIFMAAFLSEGGMQPMVSGDCDENWAKQHHNKWFAQVTNNK